MISFLLAAAAAAGQPALTNDADLRCMAAYLVVAGNAGEDKTMCAMDTDHYFTTPGARSEKADTIAKWITRRW